MKTAKAKADLKASAKATADKSVRLFALLAATRGDDIPEEDRDRAAELLAVADATLGELLELLAVPRA